MQQNWKSLIKPKTIEDEETTSSFGRFVIAPLERGFGTTLGNALRRVLLSSLHGAAVVGLRIEKIAHEFSTIAGVSEDITEIILNLKAMDVWLDADIEKIASINKKGPGLVTAKDVTSEGSVRFLNPDHVICTLSEGAHFQAELVIRSGKGYATSDMVQGLPVGMVALDAVFSPVKRVSFAVSDFRVGQRSDYNKLEMEVSTNGELAPADALAYAAKILKDQLSVFINFQEADEEVVSFDSNSTSVDARANENIYMATDELELSVRATNCLENCHLSNVYSLVSLSENDLLKTKSFGRKTLNEIKDALAELGLHLGMRVEGVDMSRIRENKKLMAMGVVDVPGTPPLKHADKE